MSNTEDKALSTQKKYQLEIPFGHDRGNNEKRPTIMTSYRTGGTPWFIFINRKGEVIYNGFDLDVDKASFYLSNTLQQ